mgnify:CR=1 FL=1
MDQLTLEQAARKYNPADSDELSAVERTAFKAGAEWQKEQYTRLIELIKEGIPVLLTEGFDELVELINNEIERLQD